MVKKKTPPPTPPQIAEENRDVEKGETVVEEYTKGMWM